MGAKINERGKLYLNKNMTVFVSSGPGCPRIKLPRTSDKVLFRDDYSRGFSVSRKLARLAF